MDQNSASLQLPRDLIESAIKQNVAAAVANAFGNHQRIVGELVSQILSMRVDDNGKPSDRQWDKTTFIEWKVQEAIRTATADAIESEVAKYKDQLRSHIVSLISRKNSPFLRQFAEAFTTGIVEASKNKWHLTVSFKDE